jgi:His-Xaa-Ser system protein HxsD
MGLEPTSTENSAQEGRAEFRVDLTLYSESVVFRACHEFTARCYVEIARSAPDQLVVKFSRQHAPTDLGPIEREFANALLDHRVREELERTTEPIRRLIVAQAFGEAHFKSGIPRSSAVDATPA